MRTAIALRNVVGKGQHIFVVAVIPPHGHLNADAVFFAGHEDRLGDERGFGTVEIAHEFAHAALIDKGRFQRLGGAFIAQGDAHTGIQKGQFAQAVFERFEAVFEV